MQTESVDVAERNAWVTDNIAIAGSVVWKRYRGYPWLDLHDLKQEATIGMMRAYECHEPDRGATLSTLAHWHARAKAHAEMRRERGHIHWCPQDLERSEARQFDRKPREGWMRRREKMHRKGWEDAYEGDDGGSMLRDRVGDGQPSAFEAFARKDELVRLRSAIARAEARRLLDRVNRGQTRRHGKSVGANRGSEVTVAVAAALRAGLPGTTVAESVGVSKEAANQERRKIEALVREYMGVGGGR